jgi:hypothetical protein
MFFSLSVVHSKNLPAHFVPSTKDAFGSSIGHPTSFATFSLHNRNKEILPSGGIKKNVKL